MSRDSRQWPGILLVDGARLSILLPTAFFLSVLRPEAREPNGFVYLAYAGAVLLAIGVLVLGVGLLRASGRDAA